MLSEAQIHRFDPYLLLFHGMPGGDEGWVGCGNIFVT